MSASGRDTHDVELDRTAWNLPSPLHPQEVPRPRDTQWPPWPFAATYPQPIAGHSAEPTARLPAS